MHADPEPWTEVHVYTCAVATRLTGSTVAVVSSIGGWRGGVNLSPGNVTPRTQARGSPGERPHREATFSEFDGSTL